MLDKYLLPFQAKRLNQVVIPGSHDAGVYQQITSVAQCHDLDIFEQAFAGVRWFDIRIATKKIGLGKDSNATFEQRAVHGPQKKFKHKDLEFKTHQRVIVGGWGGRLEDMLNDAKSFVSSRPSEFLVFKISKSANMDNVVETCIDVLGDKQYKASGSVNLNMKKVAEVGGRVITLFAESELRPVLQNANGMSRYDGCFTFKELYDSDTKTVRSYKSDYNGLQYFGKYGNTPSPKENTKKQQKILSVGNLGAHRDAMGMMYWTCTSSGLHLLDNIKKRNDKVWAGPNVLALLQTWNDGLKESIQNQMGRDFVNHYDGNTNTFGTRGDWNCFMPNIVMVDFADELKCQTIQTLNYVANDTIERMVRLRD